VIQHNGIDGNGSYIKPEQEGRYHVHIILGSAAALLLLFHNQPDEMRNGAYENLESSAKYKKLALLLNPVTVYAHYIE
jgi:hypothetical protein